MSSRHRLLINVGAVTAAMLFGAVVTALILRASKTREAEAGKPARTGSRVILAEGSTTPRTVVPAEGPKVKAPPVEEKARVPQPEKKEPPKPVPRVEVPATTIIAPDAHPTPTPAAKVDRPRPEDVLRRKGLTRSGPVFVLDAEERIRAKFPALEQIGIAWQFLANRMGEVAIEITRLEGERQKLIAEQRSLETRAGQTASAPSRMTPKSDHSPSQLGEAKRPGDAEKEKQRHESKPSAPEMAREEALRQLDMNEPGIKQLELQFEFTRITTRSQQLQQELGRAQSEYNDFKTRSDSKGVEFYNARADVAAEVERLMRRYRELNDDPEVVAALAELNKDSLRVTVGTPGNHNSNLNKMLSDVLQSRGATVGRKGQIEPLAAHAVKTATQEVERAAVQLLKKMKTAPAPGAIRLNRQRLALSLQTVNDLNARLAKAKSADQKKKLAAELKTAEGRLANASKEEGFQNNYWKARDDFVQAVVDLRAAVDEAKEKQQELTKVPVNLQGKDLVVEGISDLCLKYLKDAEDAIRSQEVAVEQIKAESRVQVLVNQHSLKMVIDPRVETVRLSGAMASRLGIRPAKDTPTVKVTLDDGSVVEAWQIFLEALQVGSDEFRARDVECLVFKDRDLEPPPMLGASFLKRFYCRLDAEAGKLILKSVNLTRLKNLSIRR